MQHLLGKVIILLLITASMTYASNNDSLERAHQTMAEEQSYKHMSTAQLQEEVEKRSINGDLSFAMGLELMKRWSEG